MVNKEEPPISKREIRMGQEMSTITFSEFIQELTGAPFEEVYKDYLAKGMDNENNME